MTDAGLTVEEIAGQLHKKEVTVRSYLPIERVIYNLEERSVNADRLQRFKERHGGYKAKSLSAEDQAVEDLQAHLHSPDASLYLWKAIIAFQNHPFQTTGRGSRPGVEFTYSVSRAAGAGGKHYGGTSVDGYGNELWITTEGSGQKKKSISRSTVDLALKRVLEMDGVIKGPRALNIPGAHSYLYPVFVKFGLIVKGE